MPFLAPALPYIGAGLSALGGIGRGRAQGRLAEDQANQQYDRNQIAGAQLNLQAPGMRANNAVRGDILSNAQDVGIHGPIVHTHGVMPTVTGGLRPSIMSGNTRQLGQQMSREALLSQMNGPAWTPTPRPRAGLWDRILNTAGGIGDFGRSVGAFGDVGGGIYKKVPPRPMDERPWDEQGIG